MPTPERKARENIERLITQARWAVRDQNDANILASRGLAIRNLTLKQRHEFTDYFPLWMTGLKESFSLYRVLGFTQRHHSCERSA